MNPNYYRHELSNSLWIRRLRKGEKKVDEILDSFIQQNMKIWAPGKYLFSPKVAFLLFITGSIFHAIFATFFYINFRSNSFIEYISEPIQKNTSTLFLNITSDIKGPVNLNIYIDNFYQNFRSFVQSRPSDIFPGFSCGTAKTVGYMRKVRGDTLNNYISQISLGGVDESNSNETPFIPCGLSSMTFFNDEFEIYLIKENEKELINISFEGLSLKNDFSMFAIPYNKIMWIKTTDIHYRIWMHGAWLPNFKMVWGQIPQDLKRGNYEIRITQNMWPAEDFDSRKRIGIEKVSFLGTQTEVYP
ncbi:LEM3 (ligand-effect modulator 3) family / CDC50 family protein [Cryptosporidium felis]|nr:LEM3 (ligand-effect modulator 3) family / CDC50 family protein [Cryptosporidium felis]